ncbi:hypothetical protein AK830_g2114 [Neonectria ditissima]|uniref:Uncharacterized protein n=1 Tax=Neonectria ditissima TaxID=78410 RepID=A0A0P7BL29_9HYPO|nr:hypothetical protein AK830_g2114 [Neonectria ditissima]
MASIGPFRPPTIANVSLDSIFLDASVDAHFSLSTSSSDITIQVGGGFDFEGLSCTIVDFTVDVPIQTVSDVLSAILTNIDQNAGQLFSDLLSTASAWAGKVEQDVITGVECWTGGLSMKDAGFAAETIAGGLQDVFGLSQGGVAQTMAQAGFPGLAVAGALQAAFGDNPGQIASALRDAFGLSPHEIRDVLGQIGFDPDDIKKALQSLGGVFSSQAGQDILHDLFPLSRIF